MGRFYVVLAGAPATDKKCGDEGKEPSPVPFYGVRFLVNTRDDTGPNKEKVKVKVEMMEKVAVEVAFKWRQVAERWRQVAFRWPSGGLQVARRWPSGGLQVAFKWTSNVP